MAGGEGSQDIHPLGSASTPPLRDRTAGPQCQAQACPQTRGSRTGENGPQSSGKQTLSFPDYRKDTTRGQPGLGAATERPRPLWARHLPAQTCPLSWKLSALETRGILTVASPRRCHWSLTLPRRRGCVPGLRAGARAHPESPHENERPSPQPREPEGLRSRVRKQYIPDDVMPPPGGGERADLPLPLPSRWHGDSHMGQAACVQILARQPLLCDLGTLPSLSVPQFPSVTETNGKIPEVARNFDELRFTWLNRARSQGQTGTAHHSRAKPTSPELRSAKAALKQRLSSHRRPARGTSRKVQVRRQGTCPPLG